MVEPPEVEGSMKALAQEIAPELVPMNDKQRATYNLAHALGSTFVQ